MIISLENAHRKTHFKHNKNIKRISVLRQNFYLNYSQENQGKITKTLKIFSDKNQNRTTDTLTKKTK